MSRAGFTHATLMVLLACAAPLVRPEDARDVSLCQPGASACAATPTRPFSRKTPGKFDDESGGASFLHKIPGKFDGESGGAPISHKIPGKFDDESSDAMVPIGGAPEDEDDDQWRPDDELLGGDSPPTPPPRDCGVPSDRADEGKDKERDRLRPGSGGLMGDSNEPEYFMGNYCKALDKWLAKQYKAFTKWMVSRCALVEGPADSSVNTFVDDVFRFIPVFSTIVSTHWRSASRSPIRFRRRRWCAATP